MENIAKTINYKKCYNSKTNARCVPVGTILIAPVGRNEKEMFRG